MRAAGVVWLLVLLIRPLRWLWPAGLRRSAGADHEALLHAVLGEALEDAGWRGVSRRWAFEACDVVAAAFAASPALAPRLAAVCVTMTAAGVLLLPGIRPAAAEMVVRAEDPAGEFTLVFRNGSAVAATVDGVRYAAASLVQTGDSVRVVDARGRTLVAVAYEAPGTIRWEARPVAVDTMASLAALARFDAACDAEGRRLWGASLCGPLVLVNAATRVAIANRPDAAGSFTPKAGGWVGTLPAGLPTANTVVEWEGERWAMALLPLPADTFSALALIAHEAFHRIQPALGLAARDAANPHLDTETGRLWLRLELRALAAALRQPAASAAAVHDALHFRAARHRLHPGVDTLEALLERAEGLAEYTGVAFADALLGGGPAKVAGDLTAFERRPSFVRSLGYATGPAMGLLLDARMPDWRRHAAALPLSGLLAEATEFDLATARALPPDSAVARARRYGYDAVAAEEAQRAAAAAARDADIRARLLAGAVLLLEQADLRASFNPNELVPVGDAGTYYPAGTFTAAWGTVQVSSGGALVAPDWRSLRLPAEDLQLTAAGREATGAGWRLQLAPGWRLVRAVDGSWRAVSGAGGK